MEGGILPKNGEAGDREAAGASPPPQANHPHAFETPKLPVPAGGTRAGSKGGAPGMLTHSLAAECGTLAYVCGHKAPQAGPQPL